MNTAMTDWNWKWVAAPSGNCSPYTCYSYINNWEINDANSNTDYLLIKAKENEPKYLMEFRSYGCSNNFLVSMHKTVWGINNSPHFSLNLNILLEGFYIGGGLKSPCLNNTGISGSAFDADSIRISVMQATPPYNLVDEQIGILKTNGDISVNFGPGVTQGSSYYLKLNHRNSVETWSATPVTFNSSPVTYAFSDAPNKAFGNNQSPTGANQGSPDGFGFALFTGDINHDGAVDASDFLEMDPEIQSGSGGYDLIFASGDLNSDGAVDASDFLIMDPNIQNGVGAAIP